MDRSAASGEAPSRCTTLGARWADDAHPPREDDYYNGRGLATAALGHLKDLAFGELGLHRVEAGALPHNVRSQRVLERNGFVRFGVAPRYLSIAGQWQDHVMYQVLST